MEQKNFCVGILICLVASIVSESEIKAENEEAKPSVKAGTEEEAIEYLKKLDLEYSKACNLQEISRWTYITNVTKENEAESVKATSVFSKFQGDVQQHILDNFPNWKSFSDPSVKRQFQFLVIRGPGKMDPVLVDEMNTLEAKMESAYAETTVCSFEVPTNCSLRLEPEIEEKLRTATSFDELNYYWTAWHDAMDKKVTTAEYKRFIELQNMMAKANGYNNMGDLWAAPYDDGSADWTPKKFEDEILEVWEELRPLYNKLHAYVRMKLRPLYADKINKFGLLPANLMGNMWAQDWTALNSKTRPYPDIPSLDATAAMVKANYTPKKMFEVANDFFKNLGLTEMTQTFWEKSMIERPDDREVVCHASAEDFCLGAGSTDFRIKMCTNVNQDDLVTVHHEMGHIEYFMEYSGLPLIFRDGANPGFHEAIGDSLALAVTTPKHMKCVLGLDIDVDINCTQAQTKGEVAKTDINFLYYMALQKFSFFPFAISMDSWRWGVFDGSIPEAEYNTKWWEIRQKNQGIEPPSPRSDTSFDASAKYHIVANVEYIRYFISHILQFQFYEAMCIAAGEYKPEDPNTKPLYQCDFNGSKEAGKLFGDMMKLGFSEPWPEALRRITGSSAMNTKSLLNYFEPLFSHMEEELVASGETVGFGGVEFQEEIAAKYVTEFYEEEATKYCNLASLADFNWQTNLTNQEAEEEVKRRALDWAEFDLREFTTNISHFNYEEFRNESLQRQIKFLKAIGPSALNSEDFSRYKEIVTEMTKIYATARVCPFTKTDCNIEKDGLALVPDVTKILGELNHYHELAYLWKAWRDATGKKMRDLYVEYVDLSNKAALANGYDSMGHYWMLPYESETFRQDIRRIWEEVRVHLYEPLYNFVRYKLAQNFPQMNGQAAMPAHVLGNMWSQTWEHVLPLVLPYPTAASYDVTEALREFFDDPGFENELMKRQQLFDYANTFYKRLDLQDMKIAYHDKALILKPDDTEVNCHVTAWDMCDGQDFRIQMCTEINHQDFLTAHHEMGHIQYFWQYKDLPFAFRKETNPGFHEAIGDVVGLSVSTPGRLYKMGLVKEQSTPESMLNYLMQIALNKIPLLPFSYMLDSYRWQIFNGQISSDQLTYGWLKMRAQYQGILPPVIRNESDFDAGAIYQVPSDTQYINYFVSHILQFQIYKQLCTQTGQYPKHPLYQCDFYFNGHVGDLLGELMKSGRSKHWQDLLEEFTGSRKLDESAIMEYFEPLLKFLTEQADTEKYPTGWDWTEFKEYYDGQPTSTTTRTDSTTKETSTTSTSTELPVDPDDPQQRNKSNDTVKIIVASVLGGLGIFILVGFIVYQKCGRKRSH